MDLSYPSMGTTHLPIEDHPELMTEYGRAFAYINIVEAQLDQVIRIRGGLINADILIVSQILSEMMFGKKLKLVERILGKRLMRNLYRLNDERLLLAHGVTGGGKDLTIMHKKTFKPFTKVFLEDTIKLAKSLHDELVLELIKV